MLLNAKALTAKALERKKNPQAPLDWTRPFIHLQAQISAEPSQGDQQEEREIREQKPTKEEEI
jgi:hypothetical protein